MSIHVLGMHKRQNKNHTTTQLLRVGFEETLKHKPIWTINPINKVAVFINTQKEKDHKREMFQIKKFLK